LSAIRVAAGQMAGVVFLSSRGGVEIKDIGLED
jgi:hypothetical protein